MNIEQYRERLLQIREKVIENPGLLENIKRAMQGKMQSDSDGGNRHTYYVGSVNMSREYFLLLKRFQDRSSYCPAIKRDTPLQTFGPINIPQVHPIYPFRHEVTHEYVAMYEALLTEQLNVAAIGAPLFSLIVNDGSNVASLVEDVSLRGKVPFSHVSDQTWTTINGRRVWIDLKPSSGRDIIGDDVRFDSSFFYIQPENRIDITAKKESEGQT